MIQALFSGERAASVSPEAFSLYEKSHLGEKKQNKIEYALVEALFLSQENRINIFSSSNSKEPLTHEQLIKKAKKIDKKIETKLIVFSDLRKKGYIPKTALKFGAEFRVYDKGDKPGKNHARWLLFIAKEHDSLLIHEFSAKNRIAHSTKKNLLIAIVDEESDVTYYETSWLRP
jgi:tRNA-intron endonuclease